MIKESYNRDIEDKLIKATLEGDKRAFEEIVACYKKMVARTVKGMLGDTFFAEDIGQEVFIKLYYSLPDFRGEAKLSTYIQKIAVNLTLNEIKKKEEIQFSLFVQR